MSRKFVMGTVLAAMLIGPPVGAQQNTMVTGTVRSETQAPVSGASVRIPSLELLAVTNENGQYRLVVPANRVTGQTVTVTVSSIGFKETSAQVTLRATATIQQNFTLPEQAISLDEVVVTGTAGRMERRAQAAQVSTINAAKVAQMAPVQSVSNLLQSRSPGVVLRNQSGTAGTATTIRIRGQSSIDLSNDPLIFVDGIRVDGGSQQIYGLGGQQGSRLNDIRIEDIESMEVVKGPAAATLYGSDANAGVINIITKKGRANSGFTQTLSMEYGEADANFTPPDNYGRCSRADSLNVNTPACGKVPVNTVLIDNPLVRQNPFTDGRYRNLTYSLSGGGTNYAVYLSVGADDENGTLPATNDYGRGSVSSRFNFFVNEKLNMDVSMRITQTKTQLPNNDNNIYGYLGGGLLGSPRTVGSSRDGWYGNNRQLGAINAIENVDETRRIQPRFSATYSPVAWFSNRVLVGADMGRSRAFAFWPKNDIGWWDTADLNNGQISEARQSRDDYTLEYSGNINRSLIPDLRLDLSFGAQALMNNFDNTSAAGTGLVNNDVRSVNAAAKNLGGNQRSTQDRSFGVYSQAQFSWREKLYVQAGVRRDQASAFGADSKPYYSPKVGLSYVISEESFFQNATSFLPEGSISQLRLRGAYGVTGRHPSSGARSTYNPTTNQITATTVAVGVSPSVTGNPILRAEKGQELELGIDAGLINDRLGLDVTYFHKKTTDAILPLPVPGSVGAAGPRVNVGALLNKGFEVAANARVFTLENVAWDLRLSAATLHNELLDLGPALPTATRKVGFPLNGQWDYRIREVDPVNNIVWVSDTLEFVGNGQNLPGWDGALASTLTLLKDFTFYAQLDGRGDVIVNDGTLEFRDRQFNSSGAAVLGPAFYGTDADGNPTEAAKVEYMRRFGCIPVAFQTSANPIACSASSWKTVAWTEVDSLGNTIEHPSRNLARGTVQGDYNQDGSFLRLREASVSYRIPNNFVQQYMRARSAQFTVTMRNLRMWTDFSGLDPETGQFLTVPQDRRWTARFQFTF